MKILVTGANGFIGRALVQGLSQVGGHQVIGLSRTFVAEPGPGATIIRCDLTEGVLLDEAVDYIVHCAAVQSSQDVCARELIAANLAMTEHVARYGKRVGVKGVIFTSSISLHGEITADVVDENTAIVNPSAYGESKHLAERVLQGYQMDFPTIALRLCGVVGAGAKNVWLARLLATARQNEAVRIYNASRLFNNVVHTDDILYFILLLLERGFSGFHAFPLAASVPIPIRSVAEEVARCCASTATIIDAGVTATSFMISNRYAMDRFQYKPQDVMTNIHKYVLGDR